MTAVHRKVYEVTVLLVLCVIFSKAQGRSYESTIYVNGVNPNATVSTSCWQGGPGLPCKTLSLALRGANDSTQLILAEGEYEVVKNEVFQQIYGIAIVGETESVRVNCSAGAGLTFINSSEITIENIQFLGCGALHNSTSRNFNDTSSFSFLKFRAGLYFLFCRDVSLSHVTVSHSNGTGAVMYATVGHTTVQDCEFSHNFVNFAKDVGGGGLYIEFPRCSPEDPVSCASGAEDIIPLEYTSNAHYIINNTVFANNSAYMTYPIELTYLFPRETSHLTLGRGGGLLVYFSNIRDSSIVVDSCSFSGNLAIWGGGLFVEFQERSWNNSFVMHNSNVTENESPFFFSPNYIHGTVGGGMRLAYAFLDSSQVRYNNMHFQNCRFSNNKAVWGGGISFEAARESTVVTPTNTLEFVDCIWSDNIGRVGAALELSVWNPSGTGVATKPVFTNCSFTGHSGVAPEWEHIYIGDAVLLADSISVAFNGFVHFEGNHRTALVVEEAFAAFLENCTANFTSNEGRKGGAIAVWGGAYIRVHEFSKLHFVNNTAKREGAAILSSPLADHSLLVPGNCFVRYHDVTVDPRNWTAEFYFEKNYAYGNGGYNNSIFTVSLTSCIWRSEGRLESERDSAANSVFCWDNWHFKDRNCTEEVISAPTYFQFMDESESYNMTAIPGQRTTMPVMVKDDRGHNATDRVVLLAFAVSQNIDIAESFIITDNTVTLFGKPNSNATIAAETIGPPTIYTEINITVLPCPPGFIARALERNSELYECICDSNFGGIVECRQSEYYSQIRRGYWIGQVSHGNETIAVVGPSPYIASAAERYFSSLPNDYSEVDRTICGTMHRTGVLCGSCQEGYAPAVNSKRFQCTKCTENEVRYGWILYILTEFLAINIFFFLLVIFNISATAGAMNAFIFYAQVVVTTFGVDTELGSASIPFSNITRAATVLNDPYIIAYDIWNLNFLKSTLPLYCLSPDLSTIDVIALQYLTAVYPVLIILLFFVFTSLYNRGVTCIVWLFKPIHTCFARFRRRWRLERSIVDAFATLLVLAYTKFALVSTLILSSAPLYDSVGTERQLVSYFNGNLVYWEGRHIFYFTVTVIVITVVVIIPSLMLLLSPWLQKVVTRIRCSDCCYGRVCQTRGKVQLFLDTFQGCYKDGTSGTRDYRYFAGVYFLFRQALIIGYSFFPSVNHYIFQQFVCTLGLFLFAVLRPYKNDFYNVLDVTIFSILVSINTLTIFQVYRVAIDEDLSVFAYALQYILIYCPLFIMLGIICRYVWKNYKVMIQHTYHKVSAKLRYYRRNDPLLSKDDPPPVSHSSTEYVPITDSRADQDFIAFTQDVEACERHRGFNYYPPQQATRMKYTAVAGDGDAETEQATRLKSTPVAGDGDAETEHRSSFVERHVEDNSEIALGSVITADGTGGGDS